MNRFHGDFFGEIWHARDSPSFVHFNIEHVTLRVIWESGFRVADVMDFSWDDDQHIRPIWSELGHPTIIIPSTQKNRRQQEVPMLPGLCQLLNAVPLGERTGWVVNPLTKESLGEGRRTSGYRPAAQELKHLADKWSNCSIAKACGVSAASVRNWLTRT